MLRSFDTVFQRPYGYFSIALKVGFPFSDRHTIFTSHWLWIEICEDIVLSKIDITMTTINKNFEIDKSRIFDSQVRNKMPNEKGFVLLSRMICASIKFQSANSNYFS